VYNSLWPGLSSYLGQTQSFQNSQLPNLEQGVQNAYYDTTQGGRNAETQAYGQQAQAGARQQASQAMGQFAGNPALAKGVGLAAMNSANMGTNNYAAQVNSPQGEQGAWANYAGLLGQASPNYSGLSAMNSAIYGQPTVPVGQGIGGSIGALLPTVTSGGQSSLFNQGLNALANIGIGGGSGYGGTQAGNGFYYGN
jgi:hypothetical protein